ncbi:unnamed protein product [Paramecium sonneborni]|uniref:Uncharacterized protein n=1 Tax=Paramecium sonneborni TaxID=65129 RepID=A0A8S1N823_9CILI|nr:unnamed protein product [Paramecium sonneborni]
MQLVYGTEQVIKFAVDQSNYQNNPEDVQAENPFDCEKVSCLDKQFIQLIHCEYEA